MQNHHHIQHKQHEYDVMQEFYQLLDKDDIDAAKKLITKDNIGFRGQFGHGVVEIFCTIGTDNLELLQHLVHLGADFRLTYDGWGPLHSTACVNKHNLARGLINLGIPVDTCDSLSFTPLSYSFGDFDKKRKTAMVLLDAGAKLSLVKRTKPAWAQDFVNFREKVRHSCVVVLGLLKCRSHVLNGAESGGNRNVNGMDVLRMITRCTWELRGVEFKCE